MPDTILAVNTYYCVLEMMVFENFTNYCLYRNAKLPLFLMRSQFSYVNCSTTAAVSQLVPRPVA